MEFSTKDEKIIIDVCKKDFYNTIKEYADKGEQWFIENIDISFCFDKKDIMLWTTFSKSFDKINLEAKLEAYKNQNNI